MESQTSRLKILQTQGWKRRFTAREPRLSEVVELYEESGFEVLLEPISIIKGAAGTGIDPIPENRREGEERECIACFEGREDQYKIIFTRTKRNRPGSG